VLESSETDLWRNMTELDRNDLFEKAGQALPVRPSRGSLKILRETYLYLMRERFSTGAMIVVDGGSTLVLKQLRLGPSFFNAIAGSDLLVDFPYRNFLPMVLLHSHLCKPTDARPSAPRSLLNSFLILAANGPSRPAINRPSGPWRVSVRTTSQNRTKSAH